MLQCTTHLFSLSILQFTSSLTESFDTSIPKYLNTFTTSLQSLIAYIFFYNLTTLLSPMFNFLLHALPNLFTNLYKFSFKSPKRTIPLVKSNSDNFHSTSDSHTFSPTPLPNTLAMTSFTTQSINVINYGHITHTS